jgi:glucans biosynthesis protein
LLAATATAVWRGTLPSHAGDGELFIEPQPFAEDHVRKLAEALSQKPWEDVRIAMPPGWEDLTYDQYRDIRFNPDKSFWKGEPHRFSFDLFHSGFLFTAPVDVHVVENGQARRIAYSPELFTFGPLAPRTDGKTDMHYAGLRLRYPINSKDYSDEFLVFQGASYFRGVAKGLLYGLSARGLAVDTGQPKGEEFPLFRAFWVRKPEEAAASTARR